MVDFSNHTDVVQALSTAQEFDENARERAREAVIFLEERGGQWEDHVQRLYADQPRFQIDKVDPIVNQIAARIQQTEFGIKVDPMGDGAAEEDAELISGIVRDIETRSDAPYTYSYATVEMVASGLSGWRITQRYVNDRSFDQELAIEPIYGFLDRVWFDPAAQRQDKGDAQYAFVVQSMSKDEYDARFPNGSGASISQDILWSTKMLSDGDLIYVGQIYYLKDKRITIAEVTDPYGVVSVRRMERGDQKRLTDLGWTINRKREEREKICYSRLFGPSGWLTDEEETVFDTIPVVPIIANYKIVRNEQLYRGVVEKLMDPQRVYNYTKSTEVSQVALGPRPKPWLTPAQAQGHEDELSTLNTNAQAYQLYNPDPEVANPPAIPAQPTVNPNLFQVSESMNTAITEASGQFAASMGDNVTFQQSGDAIERLQAAGDLGTIRFLKAMEVGICRTFRIIVDALPRIMDTRRDVRVRNEDGTVEVVTVNDQKNGMIENDLSRGRYDVTCEVGPSFKNRQQETVSGILEMAKTTPIVQQIGLDVLLRNVNSPGFNDLAERARRQLFIAGQIPFDQMTDEEKAEFVQMQQAQAQQPQGDPAMLLAAEAEMVKAQAQLIDAQNKQADIQLKASGKGADVQLKAQDQEHKRNMDMVKANQEQQKIDLQRDAQEITNRMNIAKTALESGKLDLEEELKQREIIKISAETLKILREAMGVDAAVGPGPVNNYATQSNIVSDDQREYD